MNAFFKTKRPKPILTNLDRDWGDVTTAFQKYAEQFCLIASDNPILHKYLFFLLNNSLNDNDKPILEFVKLVNNFNFTGDKTMGHFADEKHLERYLTPIAEQPAQSKFFTEVTEVKEIKAALAAPYKAEEVASATFWHGEPSVMPAAQTVSAAPAVAQRDAKLNHQHRC